MSISGIPIPILYLLDAANLFAPSTVTCSESSGTTP
ncbi:hypothetical protein ACP_3089 [Acidobacterium capsulatum ATCC 51196]|uniref:Uncharacterized protein n=1 Tax=Acidobacterium capsulatum (strain ATCC 51196 / DSM 11244 / BCRC 80197 / JCM 7670 / NBRC 15755 / NCIMB 13165 / 161) TaxID=240015 RepID=C1F504_ACIC5|nr:hypothetical protein ACP_3089 [Acidobacterium capsulatum ATCC 51196]